MRLDLAIVQDVGKRSEQQDSATAHGLPAGNGVMLVVADGLGGHVGGATASRLAIEAFAEATQNAEFDNHQARRAALLATLHGANKRITEASQNVGPKETMGTTLISAIVADGAVRWISVGDSHLYLWRKGQLRKLNQDHSQAGLMVASGRFKPDDKELDPYRSLLRSALTGRNIELTDDPDEEVAIAPGDVILLSSDGLNTVPNDEITAILGENRNLGAELMAARLIAAVKKHNQPTQDNTSVIVALIDGVIEPATELTAPPTVPRTVSADKAESTAVVTTPVLTGTEGARGREAASAPEGAGDTRPVTAQPSTRPARTLKAERDVVATEDQPKSSPFLWPAICALALAAAGVGGYFAYQTYFAAPSVATPPAATTPVRTQAPASQAPPPQAPTAPAGKTPANTPPATTAPGSVAPGSVPPGQSPSTQPIPGQSRAAPPPQPGGPVGAPPTAPQPQQRPPIAAPTGGPAASPPPPASQPAGPQQQPGIPQPGPGREPDTTRPQVPSGSAPAPRAPQQGSNVPATQQPASAPPAPPQPSLVEPPRQAQRPAPVQGPSTQTPSTQTPNTQAPATQAPTTPQPVQPAAPVAPHGIVTQPAPPVGNGGMQTGQRDSSTPR